MSWNLPLLKIWNTNGMRGACCSRRVDRWPYPLQPPDARVSSALRRGLYRLAPPSQKVLPPPFCWQPAGPGSDATLQSALALLWISRAGAR